MSELSDAAAAYVHNPSPQTWEQWQRALHKAVHGAATRQPDEKDEAKHAQD